MKLMIVDDHRGMRQTLRRLLATAHDEICECSDGDEAIEAYRRFRPDWVLMDIVMKDLDGISATRRITASFSDARVIVLTEHDSSQFRRAAGAAGACGFVLKENLLELRFMLGMPASSGPPRPAHEHREDPHRHDSK